MIDVGSQSSVASSHKDNPKIASRVTVQPTESLLDMCTIVKAATTTKKKGLSRELLPFLTPNTPRVLTRNHSALAENHSLVLIPSNPDYVGISPKTSLLSQTEVVRLFSALPGLTKGFTIVRYASNYSKTYN
ncbi:hypothetical protein OUZ56_004332 [Daphnia magna]|uniref:Uncharacterized protein n=1 Tax=Daphnia magna TaxID=35525 RepID=A0ABQ9YPG3_9CRUS|nr:hypothetical protein OUZ56_004332 [Daphnia magna]